MSDVEEIIYKETLVNAYKYGSADAKIVFQKIMSFYPNLRNRAKELLPIAQKIVEEINSYPKDKIEEIVKEKYPEDIIFEKEERDYLPEIKNAVKGKVKVRYPPEPSKHPHIGQMLSFCINNLIAERFDGKTVLRFDDTNPERVKIEFYDGFREVIEWMNLRLDEEVRASDFMNIYYTRAQEMLQKNDAFVCLCSRKNFTELRDQKQPCKCNLSHSPEKNIELFEKMKENHFKSGEAVVRLRGDMSSLNAALRDPVLLRISDFVHPIQGDKYIVWPMYDFESPIMEDITGVTHILRSLEFGKMREELQSLISRKLKLKVPYFMEYSRYSIIGAPTQGRIIRELVEEGIVTGWDDYRLVTFQALRRRGIQPEVFPEIIKKVGATKSITSIDWSLISSINRKIIEPKVKHLFFVENPLKIILKNPAKKQITIPFHPKNKELGTRDISVYDTIYLAGSDVNLIKEDTFIRLMDLYNIRIDKKISEQEFKAEIIGDEILENTPRIQWVAEPVEIEIVKPEMLYLNKRINKDSLKYIQGYGEKELKNLEIGEIVQLVRFGYAKINKITDNIKMNYIHG